MKCLTKKMWCSFGSSILIMISSSAKRIWSDMATTPWHTESLTGSSKWWAPTVCNKSHMTVDQTLVWTLALPFLACSAYLSAMHCWSAKWLTCQGGKRTAHECINYFDSTNTLAQLQSLRLSSHAPLFCRSRGPAHPWKRAKWTTKTLCGLYWVRKTRETTLA